MCDALRQLCEGRFRHGFEENGRLYAGFIAALKARFDDRYDSLETIREHAAGQRPPLLDAYVLKKHDYVRHLDQ